MKVDISDPELEPLDALSEVWFQVDIIYIYVIHYFQKGEGGITVQIYSQERKNQLNMIP